MESDKGVKQSYKKEHVGKPQLSLLPKVALDGAAKAFMYGNEKYAPWSWVDGHPWSLLIDAAMRHITQTNDGELYDKESGLLHVYHAISTLMMLAYMIENRGDLDDRKGGRCDVFF